MPKKTSSTPPTVRERTRVRQPQTRLQPPQIDEPVAQYQAGATLQEVGERFDVTAQTAAAHLERRGIPRRQRRSMTADEINRARELYDQGESYTAIGRVLGFSANTVKKAVKRAVEMPVNSRASAR